MDYRKINIGLWATIAFNLFLLGEYLYDHNNAKSVVLLFWLQSILLGVQNIFLMLFAKTGLPMMVNNKMVESSFFTNAFMAGFFLIHYGIFILGFGAIAVLSEDLPGEIMGARWVVPAAILLMIGAIIELPSKIISYRRESTSLIKLMFVPYIRLIPLAAVWLGSIKLQIEWVFPLFMLLKIIVDIVYYEYMDVKPHYLNNVKVES